MAFQGWTKDEIQDQHETKTRKLFDEAIAEKHLGPPVKREDFDDQNDIDELINLELNKNEEQEGSFAPDQDILPDDAYNNNMGAELTLQKGKQVTTDRVKKRKLNGF